MCRSHAPACSAAAAAVPVRGWWGRLPFQTQTRSARPTALPQLGGCCRCGCCCRHYVPPLLAWLKRKAVAAARGTAAVTERTGKQTSEEAAAGRRQGGGRAAVSPAAPGSVARLCAACHASSRMQVAIVAASGVFAFANLLSARDICPRATWRPPDTCSYEERLKRASGVPATHNVWRLGRCRRLPRRAAAAAGTGVAAGKTLPRRRLWRRCAQHLAPLLPHS